MNDVICECGWTKYLEEVRSPYSDPDFEWVCSNLIALRRMIEMDEEASLMPIVNMKARCPYCNEVTRFDHHPECEGITPVRTCGHFDGYFEEDEVWWVGFLEGRE